jgi:hypothetical protein
VSFSANHFLLRCGLGLWLLLTPLLGGLLVMLHDTTLPIGPVAPVQSSDHWTALHILATQCPCSERILKQLLKRGALTQIREKVALVDGSAEIAEKIRGRGFEVECLSPTELEKRYGQAAAPLLIVHNREGRAVYAGAYSVRPQLPSQDLQIFRQLQSGVSVAAMPPQGCAVSSSIQQRIDPLGLKYGQWRK